jgi:ADP-ribosylglycohydrolase
VLLELAVGDAYGAGFEYADRDFVAAHNDLSGYVRHPRHGIIPGHYTDDTQMSLAVAEAILSDQPWTPQMLADRFVGAFKRDPREGYAQGFYDFLRRVESGAQFLAEIRPDSDKSGAAMRAAPIGVYPTVAEVIERATVQAPCLAGQSVARWGRAAVVAIVRQPCFQPLHARHQHRDMLAQRGVLGLLDGVRFFRRHAPALHLHGKSG